MIDHVDVVDVHQFHHDGPQVMMRAADGSIPVSLELGGKDPMIARLL